MTAPVYQTAAGAANEDSLTLTINKPSGTVAGELLMMFMTFWSNGTDIDDRTISSSGWTLDQYGKPAVSNGIALDAMLWKIAGASEPASYDVAISGGSFDGGASGGIIRISGASTTTPFAAGPATAIGGATNPNPPASGTVPLGDYLSVVGAHDTRAAGGQGPPTNYTERVDVDYSRIATRSLTGITSEDPGTFSVTSTVFWSAKTYLVQSAPTPGYVPPDADVTTTGWTATPLWSKIDDDPASPDGTVITATAS